MTLARQPRLSSQLALLALAAPMMLMLAACKKSDDSGTAAGSPVAAVAPPAGKSWTDVVKATPEGGMLMGNPKAAIKLVEYGSLSCPHCAKLASESFAKLTGTYVASGKVSFEYRSFAIHGIDIPLTVLARCAAPEAFFGLVEQLYINQNALLDRAQKGQTEAQTASQLPPAKRLQGVADAYGLTDFFSARGVSRDRASACLANTTAAQTVADQAEAIGKQGIDSTPTLLINGSKISALTWAEVETALQAAGAR